MNELQAISISRLVQVRILSLSASRPLADSDSGIVEAQVKFSVKNSKDKKRKIGTVQITLIGKPSKPEEDKSSSNKISFKLDVEARGVYSYPEDIDAATIKISEDMASIMCMPIYLFAKIRAENALRDMGLPSVRVDPDLRTVGDKNENS
ncbi:hypothetical protein [Delftia acidovorans]|uniref:hypothetical protein n=1 Tax=Delftia acidovorans TaxID=80866 RepID=UPI00114394D3|nr:hypothetical protein [Delftia acidovorans]